MDDWISKQSVLLQVARDRQTKSDFHALVEYDPAITEYPVNSYVLFTPPVGRSDKLLSRHRGPYQVVKKTQSIYIIEDLVNGKRTTPHIHNLRPFNYDPARTMPLDVVHHNEQEFAVEAINGHRGDRQKRSTMEFKVRWASFGEACDSREPYKALLHVDKLHNYLRANAQVTRAENLFQDFPRNFLPGIVTATGLFHDGFLWVRPHISLRAQLGSQDNFLS
jgi:hypothetical protein